MSPFRAVPLIRSDDGALVSGVEDISVADDTLYLSAYDRRGDAAGGLFCVPLADVLNSRLPDVLVQPLPIRAPAPVPGRPHGMDAALLGEGLQIAVISRSGGNEAEPLPEILVLRQGA